MKLFIPVAFLLASSLSAQMIGGGSRSYHQWTSPDQGDGFGSSVSNAGDVDGDGIEDIMIGAPFASDQYPPSSGEVFVYSGATGDLLFYREGGAANMRLGVSVSGAGDVNGDGFADVIMGASGASPGAVLSAGSAFVYSGADGALLHRFNGSFFTGHFGLSVSGAGDVNGDGLDDLLVGAPSEYTLAGRIHVFSGADGSLIRIITGLSYEGRLGLSLSNAGDVNADGIDDFIAGASRASPGGRSSAGSAFVYSGANGSVLYQIDGASASDLFGFSVSNVEDINADGYADFVIGASQENRPGAQFSGAAYVYSGIDGALLYRWQGDDAFDYFGFSVSGAGDVNGDGTPDIIVGANGGNYARVFSGLDGTLIRERSGRFVRGGSFGSAVSGAGDIQNDGFAEFLVGAPSAPFLGVTGGTVFVMGFSPFLQLSVPSLSASLGGVVEIKMDFPVSEAGIPYGVFISHTGTGPSVFRGATIPLTQDSIFQRIASGQHLSVIQDGFGILDSQGDALAILNLPPLVASGLVGTTQWMGALSFDPSTLQVSSVSIARAFEITP